MLNKSHIFQMVALMALAGAGCSTPVTDISQNSPDAISNSPAKDSNIVFVLADDASDEDAAPEFYTFNRGATLQLDIQVKDPETGELVNTADVALSDGQSNDDGHISYDGYYTDYDMGYVFSWDTFNLDEGTYNLTATVTYANGDVTSNSIEVHVITADPTVSIDFSPSTTLAVGEGATICLDGDTPAGFNADQFSLSDGSGHSHFDFASYGLTGWCYSWDTSGLDAGNYTIHAGLTDALGNHGESTLDVTLTE